jgi:hypothetical protein
MILVAKRGAQQQSICMDPGLRRRPLVRVIDEAPFRERHEPVHDSLSVGRARPGPAFAGDQRFKRERLLHRDQHAVPLNIERLTTEVMPTGQPPTESSRVVAGPLNLNQVLGIDEAPEAVLKLAEVSVDPSGSRGLAAVRPSPPTTEKTSGIRDLWRGGRDSKPAIGMTTSEIEGVFASRPVLMACS